MATHLQLTRACNLRCRHCYVPTGEPARETSTAQLLALFDELDQLGSPVVVLAGGEPLCRPDFFELLDGIARSHLDAFLCTNGVAIDAEAAARLGASTLRLVSLSLDGPTADVHDAMRGRGQFERAVAAARRLRGQLPVQLRVTVTRHNAPFLSDFASVARALEAVKVVLKPFEHVGAALGASELAITRRAYFEAIDDAADGWPDDVPLEWSDGIPSLPPAWTGVAPRFGCVGGTTNVTVTPEGRVTACGSVPSPDDWALADHTLLDAWHHAPALTRWRALPDNRTCASCPRLPDCRGGCRSRAAAAGGLDAPDPWAFCASPGEGVGISSA